MIDTEGTCKICGYVSHLGAVAQHHLIPKDITQQAGMPESAKISLCCNCQSELDIWYRTKVTDTVYEPQTKRFIAKSWDEKAKDYQSAFSEFRKFKEEQSKTH